MVVPCVYAGFGCSFCGHCSSFFPQVVTFAEERVLNAECSIGDVLIVEGEAESWFYDCNAYVFSHLKVKVRCKSSKLPGWARRILLL